MLKTKTDQRNTLDNFIFWLKRNLLFTQRVDGKFLLLQEKRMKKEMKRHFNFQLEWTLVATKGLSFFQENSLRKEINAPSDEIDQMLGGMPGKELIAGTINKYSSAVMLKGGQSIIKKMGLSQFGISFDLKNPDAIKYLDDRKKTELSNYKGNITDVSKERIAKIISEAAKIGESYQQTAKKIIEQGSAGVFSTSRAELIATRELGVAYELGNNIPIKQFQLLNPGRNVLKYWRTVGDDRVTDPCNGYAEMSIEGILLTEKFEYDGADGHFSDDTAPRSTNPRCRCFTAYEIPPPK